MAEKEKVIAHFLELVKSEQIDVNDMSVLMKGLISFNPALAKQAIEISDEQLKKTHDLLEDAKKTNSLNKVDTCVELLSRRYSVLLSQIGTVESQLELCDVIRAKAEQVNDRVKLGDMPAILILDFVKLLKESIWSNVIWEEEQGTAIKEIVDYARLVTIYAEPNKAWDGQINFVFKMHSYITEADFEKLCNRMQKKYNYYTHK